MDSSDNKENLDFNQVFANSMVGEQMVMIDSLIRAKQKDSRFPLDVNVCVHLAAKMGNSAVLNKLLSLHPRLSFEDSKGRRALHHAAMGDHIECVKILLKNGSPTNCLDRTGKTPLHLACAMGYVEIVRLLMSHCAHLNSCSAEGGENAVHITAAAGHIEIMKLLLDAGADPNTITKGKMAEFALHKAVVSDKPDMIHLLCNSGAKPNAMNENEKSPLHTACEKGFVRSMMALIEEGASLEVKDALGQTPLLVAASHRQVEVVRILLEKGADVRVETRHGMTALHIICTNGCVELIDVLVEAGADINAQPGGNLTALLSACSRGRLDSIRRLVELGADVTLPNISGLTALHLVHRKVGGDPVENIIEVLLQGGARLDARDTAHTTPLQTGLIIGTIKRAHMMPYVKLLCEAGSELAPDEFSCGKKSPLFWLAYAGLLQEALYLVRAGWDLRQETWIQLPGRNAQQDKLHQLMVSLLHQPTSLLSRCRQVIRSHLSEVREHRQILTSIELLPLPVSIRQFLCLRDIDPNDMSLLEEDHPELEVPSADNMRRMLDELDAQ